MVLLMSRLDMEPDVFEHGGQTKRMTWLSGRGGEPGKGPEVFYSESLGPGAVTRTHFHQVDQFQVFLEGEQRLGSAAVTPIAVHYADAHTPYGPITGDDTGVHYLTCRAVRDPGAMFTPESLPLRRHRGGRHASVVVPPAAPSSSPTWTSLIGREDDGLLAEVADLAPGAVVASQGPSRGAGVAYVVVRGALHRDGRDHPVQTTVFAGPGEDPGPLEAGPDGLTVLALGYPAVDGSRPNDGGVTAS